MNSPPSLPLISQDLAAAGPSPVLSPSRSGASSAWITTLLLQISHRIGAIALLATLAAWGMMYAIRDFHVPLAIAGACADAGLCTALTARLFTRPGTAPRREANGVAVFNLVLFILALQLMIFARLDVIRSAASEFFTPTPPVSSHP